MFLFSVFLGVKTTILAFSRRKSAIYGFRFWSFSDFGFFRSKLYISVSPLIRTSILTFLGLSSAISAFLGQRSFSVLAKDLLYVALFWSLSWRQAMDEVSCLHLVRATVANFDLCWDKDYDFGFLKT